MTPAPFFYSIFGLYLNSNLAIPGLIVLPSVSKVDVQVSFNEFPPALQTNIELKQKIWWVSRYKDENDRPLVTIWQLENGDYWRWEYGDRTEFIIDRKGTQIWANWPNNLTLEDTVTYLLGPIFGFVLRLRGVVCLHASAVAIEDKSIAILGPAGAGKSTTAAAFAQAGFAILSDDIVPILERDNHFLVQPAYPRLRLWPTSVKALYGEEDALPCLTPNWDKRFLDLTQPKYKFQELPLPLGVIYILSDRTTSPSAPFLERIPSNNGLISLISNTYANNLLDKKMRATEFDLLSRVLAKVPLRRVTPHADSENISKLCDVILEDFHKLSNNV
ncbi:serine/threonine protein kinase [Floridanema evergladense]|uniref:Serine/threonine protein kinase n=1 Tax=Floridaenema evergladense BLCC-F167 TaxID=3153639 RepID=A0ABV4WJK2_9CYAN